MALHESTDRSQPTEIPDDETLSLRDTGPPSEEKKQIQKVQKAGNQPSQDKRKTSVSEAADHAFIRERVLENCIKIYFHVIVYKDFGLKVNQDKVIVRAGNMKGFQDWKSAVCEMHCTKEIKDFGFLYEGHTDVSSNNVDKRIPYKYVVVHSDGEEYEYIYHESEGTSSNMNRNLFISSNYISNRVWHQYDDVCLKENAGILQAFTKIFKDENKSICEAKRKANEIMLNSIYNILPISGESKLSGFFEQLKQFYYVLSQSLVLSHQRRHREYENQKKQEVQNVMMILLNKICDPFVSKNKQQETDVKLNRLTAGIICLWIIKTFSISVSKVQLANICSVLCLEEMPREKLVGELQNAKTLFSNVPGIDELIKDMCQKCIDENLEDWIWILPVLHAFSDVSNTKTIMAADQEDVWAGLERLEYDKFTKHSSDVFEKMIKKKYLLQAHSMVIQSWLCLIPLNKMGKFLDEFPVRIVGILKACYFKILGGRYISKEMIEQTLRKCLQIIHKSEKPLKIESFQESSKASFKMHRAILTNSDLKSSFELAALSVDIILTLLKYAGLSNECKETESLQLEMVKVFDNTTSLTREWLEDVYGQRLTYYTTAKAFTQEMQAWNLILNAGEKVTPKWKASLIPLLCQKIKQEEPIQQIEIYCKEQNLLKKINLSINKCFEDCAIESVPLACKSKSNILSQLDEYNLSNCGQLVSNIILNYWPKDDHGRCVRDNDRILQHLLQWDDAIYIFKLYGKNTSIIQHTNQEMQELVAISLSVFLRARKSVIDGSVIFKHLEYILKSKKQFVGLCELIEKRDISLADIRMVLEWREKELDTSKRAREWIDSLLKMIQRISQHIEVDVSEVQKKYSQNLGPQKLNELLSVRILGDDVQGDSVSYYGLEPGVMDMAHHMHSLRNSYVFVTCWEQQKYLPEDSTEDSVSDKIQSGKDPEITLVKLKEKVFSPCCDRCKKILDDVKTGEVTFEVVDDFLKDFKNKYKQLNDELKGLCYLNGDAGRWIDERVQQIEQYHQLDLAFHSAKAIHELKTLLNLSGDFRTLNTLLDFAENFENYKQKPLSCISDDVMKMRKFLSEIKKEHIECLKDFVLRKDFLQWVKETLEDVNELKVFVDLASISAGENDIDVDRVACFHDAVLGYSSLLYELNARSGFDDLMARLQKLWKALESDRNLPKKLRDSARHIEWLKTVKESHGSVELSSLSLAAKINQRGVYIIQAPKDNKKITPDSVMQLNLQEEVDGSANKSCYTLEELKELLNKLMLMSAKGDQSNEEVDKFSEIFSNVQRLARSFIDLYLAGNMLFRTWKAEIYCSDDAPLGICMKFDVNGIDNLEEGGNLTDLLPNICRTMESLLEEWLDLMNKKRSEHYYLNFYTAEQLVFLCQQFQRRDISEEALVMLSFIKPECQKIDITTSCYTMTGSFAGRRPDRMSFALKFVRCTSVLEKLMIVWFHSMRYMSALFPGCLDLDALGMCLDSLAKQSAKWISRKFHPSLHEGCPNLVLCPSSQILSCALSIYMHSFEESLPSYDEVLLCTPQTSFEEVALFFRRCLTPGYNGKKIYSLIYADELTYDTAYKSEQLFQQLQAQSDDYYLVIICNSDREHCYIPSVFSQNKVDMIPQKPLEELQRYLRTHFTVDPATASAARIFQNGLSAGIVSSKRAGVGKSLYVKRLYEKFVSEFKTKRPVLKTIRLINPEVDEMKVLNTLLPFLDEKLKNCLIIFHIDITSSVNKGISEFLFKLFVLQYLMDSEGRIWKRLPSHLYIVEILESASPTITKQSQSAQVIQCNLTDYFPKISCCSPKQVLRKYTEDVSDDCGDPGMDVEEFRSECFQRPYQYLIRFKEGQNLDTFAYTDGSVEGNPAECLQIFLLYCGIIDPSWSELRNFAWFLNVQLKDCESSVFCNVQSVGDILPGFKHFVVDFMIIMAKDFATPSLEIADQSPGRQFIDLREERRDLTPFSMRKRWESEPHPYIFFNNDRTSMTFIGFHLQPNNVGGVDAINPRDKTVIKQNVMTMQLYTGLMLQSVPFNIDFDKLPRDEKIKRLSMVLGFKWPFDPDETYELTMDNILKILAIKMRFQCGIPVVIMGETGCGKTRLIKFLCHLCKGLVDAENMKLVKVHGGTTAEMISQNILEAQNIAIANKDDGCDTVLFFDEANTTEAISSIKEALCDRTVDGEPLLKNSGLHIIAACNPYRKHTDEMIKRLESAGLGYRVTADETKERLGSIPLRQLVYRVHALPPSMMPLVWDFGQLNNETEKNYIQQIVQRLAKEIKLSTEDIQLLTDVLSTSQTYMRLRNDECSFVSLRDVERCVEVFKWFYNHQEQLLKNQKIMKGRGNATSKNNRVAWSLVLAAGVCYHASLETKDTYREDICKHFAQTYHDPDAILHEISVIQDLFLSGVHLRDSIARNLALKENLFMMVICIELKIPLFLVGKPGSSKSLAKTIVADAMQGQAAHTDLYKDLKQIHLVSYQCSPHSTPESIIGTFKQCARFQEGKNLSEYVSVVVLDEIGLAEDSAKMPLKTLHPLLEDGCIDDDPLPHKKVGFIGISNWALDPAKMNRGIFVSRGDPNADELIKSAQGICSADNLILKRVSNYFKHFAEAYQKVCRMQKEQKKEFFGLRDFYSLIKMVFAFTKQSYEGLTEHEIARAVLRNFSGKDDLKALDIFIGDENENLGEAYNTIDLVMENIKSDSEDCESRYLLILTKNYAALQILQQAFINENQVPEIIFGSSFPKDQEYTQICRNINRVKICMETGQMVILLNLQNLYESLYDALNQYYVYLAGQKYVDLGLGTHRVKCRVHPKFRLIVIEEKDVVYKDFPIPLINRLEKHYLDISTYLKKEQKAIVQELEAWVKEFSSPNLSHLMVKDHEYSPSDVFIGYHSDACASVVLQVLENMNQTKSDPQDIKSIKTRAKKVLLKCATPDSVIRFGNRDLIDEYFKKQHHGSILDLLCSHITSADECQAIFTEVTTFSRLLTSVDKKVLESELQNKIINIEILSLQQFDTEFSFTKKIRTFLESSSNNAILIIQTDFEEGSQGAKLIASAEYSAVNEINKLNLHRKRVFVYFITKLPRIKGGTSYAGFRGGFWQSVHIDDLRKSRDMATDVTALLKFSISHLFRPAFETISATDHETAMEDSGSAASNYLEENNLTEVNQEVNVMEEYHKKKTDMSPATSENMLNTTTLIRSCVQNAIGLLRDEENIGSRSTRRIEILINLLSSENGLKDSFLANLKYHLHNMLKSQENLLIHAEDWVVREAANLNALQEAGTFRQSLWKRVQKVVTPFLSHILSIIDCNGNLEILVNDHVENVIKSLWMFFFSAAEKLLPVPSNLSSQTETILVKNTMNIAAFGENSLPFSWRIKDYLEEIWTQARYIDCMEGSEVKFKEIFSQISLGKYFFSKELNEQEILLLNYQRDFILMSMTISSPDELKVMEYAFSSCIEDLRKTCDGDEQLSLPWVHIGYNTFQHRLQNLSRILALSPPSVLKSLIEKIDDNDPMIRNEMVLDTFAATACVEILKDSVRQLPPQAWMSQVKNIQMSIQLLCSEEYLTGASHWCKAGINQIRSDWNGVFAMALFMEHMLVDEYLQDPEMRQIIIGHTNFLGRCLENFNDIKSREPFMAVVDVLHKCRHEVSQSLSRFGMQTCAICQSDPTEPVCLPCDHIFCKSCLTESLKDRGKACPVCKTELPETFTIEVSTEIRDSIQKNVQFRKRCNGFFVDIICTMCFKDNTPPNREVIEHLLSLLFGNAERGHYTRSLSPFEDAVDKTPVLRSVILKLLLKYSFKDIVGYAEEYFKKKEKSNLLTVLDTTEVYLLFVNCLEDLLFEKAQRIQCAPADKEKYLQDEGFFLQQHVEGRNNQDDKTVQLLQDVARVRLALNTAAELLSGKSTGVTNENFLRSVMTLCSSSGNDWYRVYLIRKLSNLGGIDTVQRHFKDPEFGWLFPTAMLQNKDVQTNQIDPFLVYENSYRVLRDGIGEAMLEGKENCIVKALEACKQPDHELAVFILVAVFREITLYYGARNNPDQETVPEHEALKNFIKNIKVIQVGATRLFLETLLNNSRPVLRVVPGIGRAQVTVFGLAVHMAAVLLNGNNPLLSPLRNMAFQPTRMQDSYLPTMPEDMMVYARGAIHEQLQWYRCPNGHYCTVGECGQPMQMGRCLDCGVEVGGKDHIAHQGFQNIQQNVDRTQTGHVLGLPERQGTFIAADRDLSTPAFIVLRLLTHLSMLLGSEVELQSVTLIVKPQVTDVRSFLFRHIEKDLEYLRNTLGKSADDTTTIVHLVLRQMLNPDQWPVSIGETWPTKDSRNTWERHFASLVIAPVLRSLDQVLVSVNNHISKDERISSNPIVRIVFADPLKSGERLELPQNRHVHCSKIWSFRERISIEYVMHIVQQKNEKDDLPLLWKFLENEAELKMVKFLPGILSLQKDLVKRFQNCRDIEHETIQAFIHSIHSGGAKDLTKKRIEDFLLTWNNLRHSLQTNGEIKLPPDICDIVLTMDSKFSYLLPRRQGDGLCATALVSYLIALHNSFIYAVGKHTSNEPKYSIKSSDVTSLHVINYEMEKDFVPIILSNCQYTLESGKETLQEFDLPKIQQQIGSKFFEGKPLITMAGLPTIISVQDRNYENLFKEVRKKLDQTSLPISAIDFISRDLNSFSDVCEAINIVDVMLGILSTSGGDPKAPITKYIEDVLKMKHQSSAHVLEALKHCCLKNTIALWQLLTALKSAHLLRLKRDPFADVDKAYKTELDKEGRQQLNIFLDKNGTNVFLLELHEMITIKLKKTNSAEDFGASWTLRDVLGALLDAKDVSFPELENHFPEQIALAHCIDAWKIAASKKWHRL